MGEYKWIALVHFNEKKHLKISSKLLTKQRIIMKKDNPFLEKMESLEDIELLKVIISKNDYQPEAVNAAISVAVERNLIDGNLEIISDDLRTNEDIKKAEHKTLKKVEKENIEKTNAPAKKRKKLVIRIAAAIIIFIFLLSFHIIPSRMMVFPKKTLTFSNTFVTKNHIQKTVERYNNASFIQKQAMSKDPFIQKLIEKDIIYEIKD